jgi:hypothetical protein
VVMQRRMRSGAAALAGWVLAEAIGVLLLLDRVHAGIGREPEGRLGEAGGQVGRSGIGHHGISSAGGDGGMVAAGTQVIRRGAAARTAGAAGCPFGMIVDWPWAVGVRCQRSVGGRMGTVAHGGRRR